MKDFLFYKVAVQPAALLKNKYFTGVFKDFAYLSEAAFPHEQLSVAASQLFIIHGKTAIFKILIAEYSF